MFKSSPNWSISRRLLFAFIGAAVIPCTIIILLSGTYLNLLTSRSGALSTSNNMVQISDRAQADLQTTHTLLEGLLTYVATNNPSDPQTIAHQNDLVHNILRIEGTFDLEAVNYQEHYQLATSKDVTEIRDILLSSNPQTQVIANQQQLLSNIVLHQWPQYKALQDQLLVSLATPAQGAFDQVSQLLSRANKQFAPLAQSWQQIANIAEDAHVQVVQVNAAEYTPLLFGTLAAFLFTTILVLIIGQLMNRAITRPLHQLVQLTQRISRGETASRASLDGPSEIYLVAQSMNDMLDKIVELMQVTQEQRDVLQGQVERLVGEVSGLGEGDLRVRAKVTTDVLGVLADSFNYMIEELSNLIVSIKDVSQEVARSTTIVLERMTQMVHTDGIQINRMDAASIEVERMTALSRQVAERAQSLYQVAVTARQNAQSGRNAVQEAIEGIGRIQSNVRATADKVQVLGERSREINTIVEAIVGIVHQTNRLALDASIQAALAGGDGKGFGAVAADIRRLAERAKVQASTVTNIARRISDDIVSTAISVQETESETQGDAQLTREAGHALEAIFAAVERQAKEIEYIAHMAMLQLQSSRAVVAIMDEIAASTRQNSEDTRNEAYETERLAQLVGQLRSSVEAFRLREDIALVATLPHKATRPGNTSSTPKISRRLFHSFGN